MQPGFDIRPTENPMGFAYGPGVFGPEVENRSLDAIRKKYGRGAIGAGSILHNDMGLGELAIRPQSEGDGEEEEFDEKVKGPL